MSQLLTKNTLLAAMQRQVAEAADREHPSGDLPIELEDALTDLHNLTPGTSSPSINIDIAQSSKELSRTLRKLEEHPRGVRFEQLLEGAIALQMLHDSATDGALERSPKFRETKAILALSERLGELGGNGAKVLENRLLNAIEGLSRCSWSIEPDSEFHEFISNLDTPTAFGQTLKAMGRSLDSDLQFEALGCIASKLRDLDDPDSRADYRAFREAIVGILTTSRDIPFSRELVSASESEQVAVTLLEDQIARVHSESLEYNTQEYLDCLAHFSGREGQQLLRRALREGLPEYEVWEPIETALEYSTHNITARYLGQRTAGDLGPIPESDIDQYRSLLVESALRGDSEARTELVSIMRSSYQNSGVVNEPGAFWADPDLQTLEAVSARGHLRKLLGEDPEFTQELLVHAIENWQDPNSRALLLREVACSKYQGKESSPEETKIRAQQDFEAEIQRVIAEVSGGTHEFQTDPYQTPSKEEQQQRQHTLNIGEALRQLSQLQETSAVAASALQNGEIAQVAKEMWFPEIGRTSYDRLQERLSHLTELTIVAGRNLEGIKQVATLKYHMQRINPEAQVNVQWQTDSELVAADLFSKGKGCGIAFAGYSPEQTSSVDTIIRKAQSPSFEGKFLGVLDFREERESDTRLSNVWVEGLLHSGIDSANLLLSPGFNTHSDLIYGSDEIDSAWHFTREMSAAIEVDDIDSACNTAREQILAAGEARTKVQYREEIEGLSRIKLNPRGQLLFRLHDDPRTRLYEDTAKLDSLTDWLASGDRDAPAWIAAQVGYPAAYI